MRCIDSDITLTATRGKRGDYKLPDYLVAETRTERRISQGGLHTYPVKVTYMVEKWGPRDPVRPWSNVSILYHSRGVDVQTGRAA
jgi:hypothetical protein